MRTTAEFIKEGKHSIIYAFVLPKSENVLYTRPGFIWTSEYTLQYRLSSNVTFDEQEIVFQNLRKNETYLNIDYSQITSFMVKPVQRIGGIPYQTHLIEFYLKTSQIDLQVETRDVDHMLKLCLALQHQQIEVQDPCGIITVLIKTRNQQNGYYDHMLAHYRDLAKEFQLDLPRIRVDRIGES